MGPLASASFVETLYAAYLNESTLKENTILLMCIYIQSPCRLNPQR